MSAGRSVNSQSQSWGTPQKYVTAIKKFFGGSIALDPCSNEYSIVYAETEFMLPKQDGLKEDWNYPTIYINPPYGSDRERGTSIKNWLAKCALTYNIYKGAPMSCAMIYWGDDYKKFYDVFIEFGAVVDIENLKKKKIGTKRKMLTIEFEEETKYLHCQI
ncbi:hypothetical protein MASR2M117_12900 [Paludibacter sp.]